MGLEGVEILMAVEDEFSIQIEDSDAEKIRTPGQLIDIVMTKVTKATASVCLTQRAFNRTRAYFVKQRGFRRKDIAPSAKLAQLIPRQHRIEWLRDYSTYLRAGNPPHLTRSTKLKIMLLGITVLLALAVELLFFKQSYVAWLTMGTAVGCGIILERTTRSLRLEFPPSLVTFGDLSLWLMARKPDLALSGVSGWTREQVACRVRQIVIDFLGCEKEYREEARFVEDLGMG